MTQRACFSQHSAPLSGEFGRELALKKTGLSLDELTKLVGVYQRGPRKGLLKGFITWYKLDQGGWARSGNGGGYVAKIPLSFMYSLVLRPFRGPEIIIWNDNIRASCRGEVYPEHNYPMALAKYMKEKEERRASLNAIQGGEHEKDGTT